MAKSMLVEQHSALPADRAIVSFRFGNSENNLIFDCDYAFALLKQDETWKIVLPSLTRSDTAILLGARTP